MSKLHSMNDLLRIFSIWIILTVIPLFGQVEVYIDPDNAADTVQDGSFTHPYASWQQVSIQDGGTYLQKRGTVDTIDTINYHVNNFVLGAYGQGDRPKILATTTNHAVTGWLKGNVTIRDLDIEAPNATSVIYFNGGNEQGSLIENCILHGATWGIRITGSGNRDHRIIDTEIYDILDDGVFIQWASGLEIASCNIHHVNQHWSPPSTPQSQAAGDGIQLDHCLDWHVHHNVIDRSDSGNKFCFIASYDQQSDCILEHNLFVGPKATDQGGSSVYFGSGQNLVVRYNRFCDTDLGGIYHHTQQLQVYGNIFCRLGSGITSYHDSRCAVYNNVFYDVDTHLTGNWIAAYNNIFDLTDDTQTVFGNISTLDESHNHFPRGPSGSQATTGPAGFVDADHGDFHLQPDSPCVDSGIDVGLSQDAQGIFVPQGGWDKGVYEYVDPCIQANVDRIGVINLHDFCVLGGSWLKVGAGLTGDINGDTQVTRPDLVLMSKCWLQ